MLALFAWHWWKRTVTGPLDIGYVFHYIGRSWHSLLGVPAGWLASLCAGLGQCWSSGPPTLCADDGQPAKLNLSVDTCRLPGGRPTRTCVNLAPPWFVE